MKKKTMKKIEDAGREYEKTNKKIIKAKNAQYDSTIVRIIEKVGNNSTKAINKVIGKNEDKK